MSIMTYSTYQEDAFLTWLITFRDQLNDRGTMAGGTVTLAAGRNIRPDTAKTTQSTIELNPTNYILGRGIKNPTPLTFDRL
jgi:hypothetical protein